MNVLEECRSRAIDDIVETFNRAVKIGHVEMVEYIYSNLTTHSKAEFNEKSLRNFFTSLARKNKNKNDNDNMMKIVYDEEDLKEEPLLQKCSSYIIEKMKTKDDESSNGYQLFLENRMAKIIGQDYL